MHEVMTIGGDLEDTGSICGKAAPVVSRGVDKQDLRKHCEFH